MADRQAGGYKRAGSGHMELEKYEEIRDGVPDRLVGDSKEFFMQGFLRGRATAKGGVT